MMACNKTYEEIRPGDEATLTRVCTGNDLFIFAHASGNLNSLHLPYADSDQSRLDSCAVAVLYQHWRNTGQPATNAHPREVA